MQHNFAVLTSLPGPAELAQLAGQMTAKQPFEVPHEGDELVRAARRKIDDDIDKLEHIIQSLKTKRNELSPISVLPPEVLSRIFILARDWPIDIDSYNHQAAWICVGHVCRHWRDVALSCPSLWSVPVFSRPNLAQEMMQRSKMVPLTIRLTASPWTPRMVKQLENAMAQIHRIQSIELALGYHPEMLKTLFSSLSQHATLLEDISLSDATHLMPFNKLSSLPTDALSDAPRLQSISFDRLNVSWESAVIRHRNLTSLRLSNNCAATGNVSTFSQMMDALYHLPNLRILELNDSIPSHTSSNGNEKPLEFKFLEELELRAEAVDCIFFLRHIQYPPCATAMLRSSSTAVEAGTTISFIGQNLHHAQSTGAGTPRSPFIIRSARVTSTDVVPEITFFNKLDGTNHLYIPSGAFGPFIKLQLSGGISLGLMNLYSYCFDISSLQGLLLDRRLTYNETHAILDTFGKLPTLKTINVSRFLPEICCAITENSKDSPAPQRKKLSHSFPPVTVFPALRTFVIEDVDFRQRRHPENMSCLVDMLMKRSDMNVPIDRLSLNQCRGVRTWQQRLLGELVVDLEVEGKVIDVKELDPDDDSDNSDDVDDSDEDEDESDSSYIDYSLFDPVFTDYSLFDPDFDDSYW